MNIPCLQNLPSTFINFHHLLSISNIFLYFSRIFHQKYCNWRRPSRSKRLTFNLFYCYVSAQELPSHNFHQLYVWPRDFPSTFLAPMGPSLKFLSTFLAARRPSVNFLYGHRTFCQLPSTLRVAKGINQGKGGIFCQLSVHPWDLLSTSVNSTNVCRNYYKFSVRPLDLRLTFGAAAGSSVNVGQLSVRPRVFLSKCINFL